MWKRKALGLLLVPLFSWTVQSQGVDDFARKIAGEIKANFNDQFSKTIAIVKLENQSTLSGLALERLYQMIYSHFENENENQFLDFLIDIRDGEARFNLSKAGETDFLIYLKFISERGRIGTGIVVFSRRLDRVISIKYVESLIPDKEISLLETKQFGFTGIGFSRIIELDTKPGLMDAVSFYSGDSGHLLLLYPEEIEIFRILDHGLDRSASLKIDWPSPLYPVQNFEGKLTLFSLRERIFLAAGSNFCEKTTLFEFKENSWQLIGEMSFLPFAAVTINQIPFIAGGKFETGKNFFQNRLFFLPVQEGFSDNSRLLEKSIPCFYSLGFACDGAELESVHFIDLNYTHRVRSPDLVSAIADFPHRGCSLAVMDNSWLSISDYSSTGDRLFFLKLKNASMNPTYENRIEGLIQFLSAGRWQAYSGFWACIKREEGSMEKWTLQFWGIGNE